MKAAGAALALACTASLTVALGWWSHPCEAAISWLVAWSWCFTISAGALGLDLVLEACGANWQVAIKRPLEALQAPLVPLAALFLPVALSAHLLYAWAAPDPSPAVQELLERRRALGGIGGWASRSATYLAVLIAIAGCIRFSAPGLRRRLACAALPAYAIVLTGAAWDWLMSLDARFPSTIYGAWVWASGVRAACGAWVVLAVAIQGRGQPRPRNDHLVALGRVLLAFTLVAAYMDFGQLVVAWMADLPAESGWYQPRLHGWWGAAGAVVGIGAYALPFTALLSLALKRRGVALAVVGAWVVLWHHADLAWWLVPSCASGQPTLAWACLDLAAGVAIGAASIACALAWLARAPAPEPGARLAASLAYRAEIAA